MMLPEVFGIAVALSLDCFTISVSRGLSKKGKTFVYDMLIFSLGYSTAHLVMLFAGWHVGRRVGEIVSRYEHWVAFFLLLLVGSKMIFEALHSEEPERSKAMPVGFAFFSIMFVTSLDAFVVGITYSFIKVPLTLAFSVIGLTVFIFSVSGYLVGRFFRKNIFTFEKGAEVAGGIILMLLALKILLEGLETAG